MSATTTVEIATSVVDAIATARAARDEGMAQAEESDRSGWNKALLDQAIRAFAADSTPFSANDLRHVLPDDLPGPIWGACFSAAATRGEIRFVGYVTSSKKSTHSKRVALWRGVPQP